MRSLDETGPHASDAKQLMSQRQFVELRSILGRSVVEFPTSAAAYYNLGVACEAEGDEGAAREHYAEALRHDARHEKAKEALEWLARVERAKPSVERRSDLDKR
jgi:predicted Zn-dependent protease